MVLVRLLDALEVRLDVLFVKLPDTIGVEDGATLVGSSDVVEITAPAMLLESLDAIGIDDSEVSEAIDGTLLVTLLDTVGTEDGAKLVRFPDAIGVVDAAVLVGMLDILKVKDDGVLVRFPDTFEVIDAAMLVRLLGIMGVDPVPMLVTLSEMLAVKAGVGKLVLSVRVRSIEVEFGYGPAQLDPEQLLTFPVPVGWKAGVSVADTTTTTKVVFPITVVMVDSDISEVEDAPEVETVSEAEPFENVALDCGVCISLDTVDGVPEGVEGVLCSVEVAISEVWLAGPGVNVAGVLIGLKDRDVDTVPLAIVTGSVLLAIEVVPERSAVLEIPVLFMPADPEVGIVRVARPEEVTSDGD